MKFYLPLLLAGAAATCSGTHPNEAKEENKPQIVVKVEAQLQELLHPYPNH